MCVHTRARSTHKNKNTIAKVVLIFFCFTENALDDSRVTHATPPTRHRIVTERARMVRTRAPRPRASIPSRFPRAETTPSRSAAHHARAPTCVCSLAVHVSPRNTRARTIRARDAAPGRRTRPAARPIARTHASYAQTRVRSRISARARRRSRPDAWCSNKVPQHERSACRAPHSSPRAHRPSIARAEPSWHHVRIPLDPRARASSPLRFAATSGARRPHRRRSVIRMKSAKPWGRRSPRTRTSTARSRLGFHRRKIPSLRAGAVRHRRWRMTPPVGWIWASPRRKSRRCAG